MSIPCKDGVLPHKLHIKSFQPVAYFDRHMDCIRVITHDKSVTEQRINKFYTLHENNYRTTRFEPEYTGFTIKGVTSLLKQVGLEADGSYLLADLLDKLIKYRPGSVMSETLKLILPKCSPVGDLRLNLAA